MLRRMTRDRFLSDAELGRFMAAVRERRHVHQPRDYAFFALLANTGIRPSEAMSLSVKHVKAGSLTLSRSAKRHSPSPITRLPLNPTVAKIVKRYVSTLPLDAKLFPFTKRQAARLFHYYSKLARLDYHRKVYALRHTVGMRLWRHTHDLRLIQGVMGHARLKSATAYVHVEPETMLQIQQASAVY